LILATVQSWLFDQEIMSRSSRTPLWPFGSRPCCSWKIRRACGLTCCSPKRP